MTSCRMCASTTIDVDAGAFCDYCDGVDSSFGTVVCTDATVVL
mgnify:CR=1 FL=1